MQDPAFVGKKISLGQDHYTEKNQRYDESCIPANPYFSRLTSLYQTVIQSQLSQTIEVVNPHDGTKWLQTRR